MSVICKISNCNKKVKAKEMCEMHYTRLRRNGTLKANGKINYSNVNTCIVPNCDHKPDRKGLCGTHYSYKTKYNQIVRPKVIKKCGVKNCNREHHAKGFCNQHLHEYNRNLKELEEGSV